jgi:hypothetical protein
MLKEMESLSLDEVLAYCRCPQEWFWSERAHLPRPQTLSELRALALREALRLFYAHAARTLAEAFAQVWGEWARAWKSPDLLRDLARYAEVRTAIQRAMTQERGRGRSFAQRLSASGLGSLPRELDAFAQTHRLWDAGFDQPGSRLGDVFADCFVAVDQTSRFDVPLPTPDQIVGLALPYTTELGVDGVADLVWQEDAAEGATLEVHDLNGPAHVRSRAAKADLRVIGARLARPTEPVAGWDKTRRVIYRNWVRGDSYVFSEVNYGSAQAVLAAVRRGLHAKAFVPRALARPHECLSCVYKTVCIDEGGWESQHLVDGGLLSLAEELRQVRLAFRRAALAAPTVTQPVLMELDAALERLEESGADPAQVSAIRDEAKIGFTAAQSS